MKKTNFSDAKSLKTLTKQVTEGENCQITGYLANIENNLGRSLVIDLHAHGRNPYKQVDHRSINWIIYKDVKYSLGTKKVTEELPVKDALVKWDASKLQVGNWFSQTAYYKVKAITDDESAVVSEQRYPARDLKMARNIMETEMNSGLVYDSEQKVTRTEILEKMMTAGESVMTVNFNKKIDQDFIKQKLQGVNAKKADFKKLSKEISKGQETSMTCFLLKQENGLGRSTVIDLNAAYKWGFRQIDHRTVNSMILKNVKYTVK